MIERLKFGTWRVALSNCLWLVTSPLSVDSQYLPDILIFSGGLLSRTNNGELLRCDRYWIRRRFCAYLIGLMGPRLQRFKSIWCQSAFSLCDFSAGEDKLVKCWDLEMNKVIRHYHGHLSAVYSLALHPTIDILVTAGKGYRLLFNFYVDKHGEFK